VRAEVGIRGCGVAEVGPIPVSRLVSDGLYDPDEASTAEYEGIAISDQNALALAVDAARCALGAISEPTFSAVYYASASPPDPFEVPSPATYVQRALNTGGCMSMTIQAGCAAGMMAVREAVMAVEFGRAPVLVTAADWWPSARTNRFTSQPGLVFSDGAAAWYLDLPRQDDVARILAVDAVTVPELEAMHRSPFDWYSQPSTDFDARERQFRHDNPEINVKALLGDALRTAVRTVLDDANVDLSACARLIVPGIGRRIRARYAEALDYDPDRTLWPYYAARGHTGCADPLMGLHHIVTSHQVPAGGHVLLVGEGAGFHIAVALVQIG
jgi:3-oxoacyl-[acyl-carrier-protein] synthase-3